MTRQHKKLTRSYWRRTVTTILIMTGMACLVLIAEARAEMPPQVPSSCEKGV